jgi:hypothetical protein
MNKKRVKRVVYRVIKPGGLPFLIDGLGHQEKSAVCITGLRAYSLNEDGTVKEYLKEIKEEGSWLMQFCRDIIGNAIIETGPPETEDKDD